MAKKKSGGKGRKTAQRKVGKVMREFKEGKLRSGSGGKVRSRKQAVAIGLSEAREAGARIPRKKSGSRKKKAGSRSKSSR
jgi:hypothetical protein